MEHQILENEVCKVEISDHASEVHTMIDKATGLNYIWCGDPAHWNNRNPILFPHTGSLPDKKYTLNGKEYTTGNHGFLRHAQFRWLSVSKTEAELIFEPDAALKETSYPFDFALKVRYVLIGKRLELHYRIENHDEKALPFEIGLHPAFNVPLLPEQSFEDYFIEFEQEEHASARVRTGSFELNGTKLDFKDKPFERSKAMFFAGLKSNYVTLSDGVHGLRVGIQNTEQTGFWRPSSEAPFVCIEPWQPINALEKEDTFLRGKLNNLLPAQEVFEFSTYFEIL